VETGTALSFAATLSTDIIVNINTVSDQAVSVIFVRDGLNEPDVNHDCGYTDWSDLSFNGYSFTVNTGDGNNFFESPNHDGNVIVNARTGADRFRIWYHAGSYNGGGGADMFTSEWNGDSSGGESINGGAGFDTICDHNGVLALMCGADGGAANLSTLPFDCTVFSSLCNFPGAAPTIF
jgi:hypothetical protein